MSVAQGIIDSFQPVLRERHTLIGGRISRFLPEWEKISANKTVLAYVKGASISYVRTPSPSRDSRFDQKSFVGDQAVAVDEFVSVLLDSKVIKEVSPSADQVISPIFLTKNKDNTYRLIHDVSLINRNCVRTTKFKMETLASILPLIPEGSFFVSWDIVQGFYNVAVHPDIQKFYCFEWRGKRYQFLALSMGSSESPRIFSKVVKAAVYEARRRGLNFFSYMDDTLGMAPSLVQAAHDSVTFGTLLESLGFLLHPKKSVRFPTQRILYLGFEIDSVEMSLSIPLEKFQNFKRVLRLVSKKIEARRPIRIRSLARLVGLMISCIPALRYGRAHYRSLEHARDDALFQAGRNFDASFVCPWHVLQDLAWWKAREHPISLSFRTPQFSVCMTTDASLTGWGAVTPFGYFSGTWDVSDSDEIALLELKAVWEALRVLPISAFPAVIHLSIDNQVAQAYVNHQGGRKRRFNRLALRIWHFLEQRDSSIQAFFVPSRENTADFLTRLSDRQCMRYRDIELQLLPSWFSFICDHFSIYPTCDWFASDANTQLPRFCAWETASYASFFDAFAHSWANEISYLFPPFILVPRVVQKIISDSAHGILIVPRWETASWWTSVLQIARVVFHIPQKDPYTYPQFPNLKHHFPQLMLSAIQF